MLRLDRDALECDLAETYGIFDYKALSVLKLARLSYGLRETSRIKMKMSGAKAPINTILLMGILDNLRLLLWTKTKDAEKNRRRPKSILDEFMKKEPSSVTSFSTPEEFEKRRAEILRGEV